jgi:PPK2 family polyphosphate:nucleotide phosphotransferase
LAERDPTATGDFTDEDDARAFTEDSAIRLARAQLILEAHGTHGLLVVVEGMDAAGKDEAIHHVMGAVDPGSARSHSFASMSDDEAHHDYLRRASIALPVRGEIAVFNRSYYGQVVGDRVSPEFLDQQNLPDEVRAGVEDGSLWDDRLRQIRDFERYLSENGIRVVKLFFHVSKEAQRQRLLERIERPEKRWDFGRADIEKREQWEDFLEAYETALRETTADHAPWYVIPSDQKWYGRAAAAAVVLDALAGLHDDFPEPDDDQRELLDWGRRQLEADG